MRRVRFYACGGPEVLRLEEAPAPAAGPGELLVATEAIGVTLPAVRKVRGEGGAPGLPGVIGGEVAGEVVAAGPGVTGFRAGDRVTGLPFSGSYAELAVVAAPMASRIPDGASAVQAVALVRGGHVALAALAALDALAAGAAAGGAAAGSVLITGAASGVGHLAIQLARIQGAGRVVAAVSSPAKAGFLRALGADEVVTYDSESWGEPVDSVLDGVGGDVLARAVAALAPGGRMVFFGSGGGTVPAFDLLAGSKTITGLSMARFSTTQRELYDRHGEQLWELTLSGRLRPAVHAEIPLAEAARAHEIIEARANLGKVVLLP
ncbi:MAG TPA: zinc-binding dehydrogenase [Streptosporangiaceae bacterium]|jgi:NADPH:quinone reductase-like Zn-dependent oxidoreductase